jgi:chromosome segregation ATPase
VRKLLPCLLVCGGASAHAASPTCVETYRFEDENGRPVMAQSIPPALAKKGYKVVCPDGSVVRVVPPELTAQEIVERDRKRAEEEAAEAKRKEQAQQDAELSKLYASPAEIAAARDRKLRSIDNAIAVTKSNIERLTLQLEKLQQQAAERERSGQLASPEILQNLQILAQQIKDKEVEVTKRLSEKDQTREEFQQKIERYQQLFPQANPEVALPQNPEAVVRPVRETARSTASTSGSSNPASGSL